MNTTTNEDGFTNIQAADAVIKMFDMLRLGPKGWPLFEKLYGQPFDIMAFTPDDYVFDYSDPNTYEHWVLDIGQGWKLRVRMGYKSRQIFSRISNTPVVHVLECAITFDNNWCTRIRFETDEFGQPLLTNNLAGLADAYWKDVFAAIKRRAAITIREHRNYLARSSFYDTLETELNIKLRKKK